MPLQFPVNIYQECSSITYWIVHPFLTVMQYCFVIIQISVYVYVCFWSLCSTLVIYLSIPALAPHYLNYFILSWLIPKTLFFKSVLAYLGFFFFSIRILEVFSSFTNDLVRAFLGTTLNYVVNNQYLYNGESSYPRTWFSS